MLFLDLDNFKSINDTLGHAAGDEALKITALCLRSSVREADTVSRYGGDEFLILLSEIAEVTDAVLVADKVIAALDASALAGEHSFRLTGSVGISLYPEHGDDADGLIGRADAAMYEAETKVEAVTTPAQDVAPQVNDVGLTEIDLLKRQLEDAETKLADSVEGWKRSVADFQNYRKRVERDK